MAPKSAPELAIPTSAVPPPADPLASGPQPDFWEAEAPGDTSSFFGSPPPIEQDLNAPGQDILALVEHLSSPSQLQGLPGTDDELNALLHMGQDSNTVLDLNIDPLFGSRGDIFPPSPPPPHCLSAASSLMRFREDMDRRITAMDARFSDPLKVLQDCKAEEEGSAEVENPAALLLSCSKELIDILQNLTAAAPPAVSKDSYPHNQLAPPHSAPGKHMQTAEDALSTEVVLLALSSYLAFMRLYDALFYSLFQCLCQLPPDMFKSVKVKSVLRIGGVSSLQDMPLKSYATAILDAVQDQVRTLERCMGIPPEYCLSGEAAVSHTAAAPPPGIFSRPDRARLFYAVMAQEDVKSRRGTKTYVESIRASIQESLGRI
ncbi:uncharacterized protein THITE_2109529 [Thermothielavioides terrestris NRRL 8126]|uniref:Aflatoxin regulatory protein domain-containing protein n=1 Tax=Thermothielavioides terrestris (strain ATCC 38088 / NRRL 8126) TaxID=578455 RepID=G2QWE0_THETT|nr:uncharacterized protein THITE_2109529 [Thermothielavioides terrestris NRRL 8126]AEO63915.1 hypothetical protein THITE_2109529 [Thermothielavioides terrestris NRRL 8126]